MMQLTPIELKIWNAAKTCAPSTLQLSEQMLTYSDVLEALINEPAADSVMASQVVWMQYTVDFAFITRRPPKGYAAIIVECDGHDFHEKTKEQARKDKSRDRQFQKNGFLVLRFTGSEIWKSPETCLCDVLECLHTVRVSNGTHHQKSYPDFAGEIVMHLHDVAPAASCHVAMAILPSCDSSGVARASIRYLQQETGIPENEMKAVVDNLYPYIWFRSIDTRGRLVFQFNDRTVMP